ncbi:MAG: amidohydrolase [Bacteroidales bacterium]|nr:amidohydrolase [Bacteroidales bacterium]
MRYSIAFFIAIMMFFSCKPSKKTVDLIIYNAKIYSVDTNFSIYESFAVENGKFIALGSSDEILTNYSAKEKIDMGGKTVYPGFYDAHCHFYGYGLSLQNVDLRGTKSFDEVVRKVKDFADTHPDNEWILGRAWDQNDWEDKEFPENTQLNKLFPDKPVVLRRVDGHALIANDAALKVAGIDANTQVTGGKIMLKKGKPTGVLVDNAMDLLFQFAPDENKQLAEQALLDAQKNCFAVGLTSVDDAGLSKSTVLLIDSLQKSGKLKIRIYAMLNPTKENADYFIAKGIYKTDFLNVRSIKLYADGALGSRGACLLHPYHDDPGNYGFLISGIDFLDSLCHLAYENNYQINTHAIGDSANRVMLNLYGKYLKGKNDKRWRIEHAQVIAPEDFKLFNEYSVVPSVQPTHATSDMYWAEARLGSERIKYAYAYKNLLNQNGWIAAGSDFPVEEINPLFGFYAAVVRKDQNNWPENGFEPENAISREEALKAMTIWAAKSNFEENEKGSIELGKFADFVVTDKDIMASVPETLYKIKVLNTFINGARVYSAQ